MKRPHITVVNYYGVFPINNGGKLAIIGFYKALSKWFDITIANLAGNDHKDEIIINEHLKVVPLCMPERFRERCKELAQEYNTIADYDPIHTIVISNDCGNSPELVNQLECLSKDSDILITEHAYTYKLIKAVAQNKVMCYRAQNVEYDYKRDAWSNFVLPEQAYTEVFNLEKECCDRCDLILTITERDMVRFQELYGVSQNRLLNISAGYDANDIDFTLPSKRKSNKVSALYISSTAAIAVKAAENIVDTAASFPNVLFKIAGTAGEKLSRDKLPNNVEVLGLVTDSEKKQLLEACHFALNPIAGGSGLNIKMLEYFAAGIPVICTEFGARGIAIVDEGNCIVTESGNLSENIGRFLEMHIAKKDKIAENAYALYKKNFTWDICARRAVSRMQDYFTYNLNDCICAPQGLLLKEYNETAPFIPNKDVYIYGAGEWGRKCMSFLSNSKVRVLAFLDKDEMKWDKTVNDLQVKSPSAFLANGGKYNIVFSLMDYVNAVKDLLALGLKPEQIIIAPYGTMMFSLVSGEGNIPFWLDIKKIRSAVGL